MSQKAKEKTKQKNTKDNSLFDFDNEIILGIKTLPEPEAPKTKKKKAGKHNKKTKTNIKSNNKRKNNKKNDENELKFGIEDDLVKNKTNKNVAKKKTKKKSIPKKKKNGAFKIVKWTSLCILLIGGTVYFLLSPFFNIKQIIVEGNEKVAQDEIINLSKIQIEENIFKIINYQVEKNIKQNAYIDSIKIKRELPNTIKIEVEERTPTYMINFGNAYAYINNQGYFLEVSKEKLDIPIITGFSTLEEEIHEGYRLCIDDLQRLEHVLEIMQAAESNDISKLINKINISDKQDYILELNEEKKIVHIGDTSNLSTKMLYIKTILEQNKEIEGEILVNTDLNNKGAIFRKKV